MNDVSSIESVVNAFYEVISGLSNENRNWDRLRLLFFSGAALIPSSVVCGTTPPLAISVDTYIQRLTKVLSQQDFFETSFIHRIDRYANIASVISVYEARHSPNDPEFLKRGVNYIQMLNDGNRWWITSMMWRDESKENPIPEKYLKPAGQY
jgi:hypothetical protein